MAEICQDLTTDPDFLAYDGNGNITAWLDLVSGTVLAAYEYDAFGKVILADESGTAQPEKLPPLGFSSKYTDRETGLCYYGFRYYAPEVGRWINRDPIEEEGGENLYGMVGNDAVNAMDLLGKSRGRPLGGNRPRRQPAPPVGPANDQFDDALGAMFEGGGSRSYGPGDPWTDQMKRRPVYDRMREAIKNRVKLQCTFGDIKGLDRSGQWDDSADSYGVMQIPIDIFNYIFKFGMQSSGSVEGTFEIIEADCCKKEIKITVKLHDVLRLGSATRVPDWSPIAPRYEFLPDNRSPCIPLPVNVDLNWNWEESLSFSK